MAPAPIVAGRRRDRVRDEGILSLTDSKPDRRSSAGFNTGGPGRINIFYTTTVGLTLEFQYQDFYAGIRAGGQLFHLKLVDQKDPSSLVFRRCHQHVAARCGRLPMEKRDYNNYANKMCSPI